MRTLIIADNQDITRAGLRALFARNPAVGAVCEARSKSDLIRNLRLAPDAVVILDYAWFDFNRVEELKDMGCRIQINAGELPGLLGGQLKRTARSLIKEELADLIGTDAHRVEGGRSVSMAEGASWLQRHCSPEYAARLLYKNAAHILDNTDMEDIE